MRVLLVILALGLLGACGGSADTYLPLPGEATLTYALTQVESGETTTQKTLVAYRGPANIEGHTVYQQLAASGPVRLLTERNDGIYVVAHYRDGRPTFLEQPELLLPQPLQSGSHWQAPVATEVLQWRKHSLENAGRSLNRVISARHRCERLDATVETPAGTFTDVAEIHIHGEGELEVVGTDDVYSVTVDITRWYAPGIGLVKSVRKESAGTQLLNPGEATMVLERID